MKFALGLSVLLCMLAPSCVTAQNTPDSADVHYYDGWPGSWHRIANGQVDSLPTFVIRRGFGHSFLEDWHLTIDGKRSASFGLRSWDPATRTWRLVWTADPDYFQIWDGQKTDGGWYIIRKFEDGGAGFLSRQAWWIQDKDHLLRTIERSTDGGQTWTTRYRDVFQRVITR